MTKKELLTKYGIRFDTELETALFFEVLDILYLELTPEKAHALLDDFFGSADDIYNESKDDLLNHLQEVKKDLEEQLEEKNIDKKFDA